MLTVVNYHFYLFNSKGSHYEGSPQVRTPAICKDGVIYLQVDYISKTNCYMYLYICPLTAQVRIKGEYVTEHQYVCDITV